jgi:hypothetical protein
MLKKSVYKFLSLSLSMLFISACRGHGVSPIVTSNDSSSSFSSSKPSVEDKAYSFEGEIIYTKPGKNDIYAVDWTFYRGTDDDGEKVYTQETLPLLSYYTNDHGSTIFSIHMTLSYMLEYWSATNIKSMLTTIIYQSLPTITE